MLVQRGPNTGMRPANGFCMPYFTQSHKCIALATQLLQVARHWSAGQYVTIRG